jgi:hypothetical protein
MSGKQKEKYLTGMPDEEHTVGTRLGRAKLSTVNG